MFSQGWTCVLLFCMFFLLGSLVEEIPCEHGENMQTPHRKIQEIAHLSTEGLGRTCPPEPTAPHAGIAPMTFLLRGSRHTHTHTHTNTHTNTRTRTHIHAHSISNFAC